jgi:hypothetical protein
MSLWDHSCQKSFEKRVRELPIEAETRACWGRLLSWRPLNPRNLEVSNFTQFIDCAFKVLSDHLDKVDWICRDIWKSQGLSITGEFVREAVSRKVADEMEARTSELDWRLKRIMHQKNLEDRRPVLHYFEHAKKQLKDRMSNLYDEEVRGIHYRSAEIGQERANNKNSDKGLWLGQEARKFGELKLAKAVTEAHSSTVFRAQDSTPPSKSVESDSMNAAASTNMREVFVRTILQKEGLSIHDWATRTNVDFHTADNYLKGKTKKPYPATLKKLAHALGIEVGKLPA